MDMPSDSSMETARQVKATAAARRQEIIKVTDELLGAIDKHKFADYKMIAGTMTAFNSKAALGLTQGREFHQNEFHPIVDRQVLVTKVKDPYVHVLGEDSACIAYKRSVEFIDGNGKKVTAEYLETRIWQHHRDGTWHNVHLHRS